MATRIRLPIPDREPAVEAVQLIEWLRRHGSDPEVCDRLERAIDGLVAASKAQEELEGENERLRDWVEMLKDRIADARDARGRPR